MTGDAVQTHDGGPGAVAEAQMMKAQGAVVHPAVLDREGRDHPG
jgi:hypothetical protein